MHSDPAASGILPTSLAIRPLGISAFIRCQNEEEYILPSILSICRTVDEVVVIFNNSSDNSRQIIKELATSYQMIRVLDYLPICSSAGLGYAERVANDPGSSISLYYNWCIRQTRFSHVCKWDGDMIATPEFHKARSLIGSNDVVSFDGHDILSKITTSLEPRIFKFNLDRARYVDWDLYEILQHDFSNLSEIKEKCYLHMKLVKRINLGSEWLNPNDFAKRSPPPQSVASKLGILTRARVRANRVLIRVLDKLTLKTLGPGR